MGDLDLQAWLGLGLAYGASFALSRRWQLILASNETVSEKIAFVPKKGSFANFDNAGSCSKMAAIDLL